MLVLKECTTVIMVNVACNYWQEINESVVCKESKCLPVSLQTDFQRNSLTAVQDAVTKLQKCAVEIKMKAEFADGCGPTQ